MTRVADEPLSLRMDQELGPPSIPDIAPNRGFMIDTDGNRIESVYKTPRPCLRCGEMFIPKKHSHRRISETCSDGCRRNYATAQITASRNEVFHRPKPIHRVEVPNRERKTPILRGSATAIPRDVPRVRDRFGRFVSPGQEHPTPVPVRRPKKSEYYAEKLMDVTSTFGKSLARRRIACGWTHEDISGMLGVSINTYRNWEYDKNTPPADKLALMARLIGCSMDDLWYGGNLPQ